MRESIQITANGHTYIFLYEPTYNGMAKLLRHWTYLMQNPNQTTLTPKDLMYLYNCLRERINGISMGF